MKCLFFCFCVLLTMAGYSEDVGWRHDGSGIFNSSQAPVKWSTTENVVWKTAMPSWSNSTPIIVGDKLFVCAEKFKLVCLSVKDGKKLWEKETLYMDAVSPQEMPAVKEGIEKGTAVRKKMQKIQKELNNVRKKLRKDKKNEDLKKEEAAIKKRINEVKKELKPYVQYLLPKTHGDNGYSSQTPASDGKHVYVLFGNGVAACYDLDGNRKWIRLVARPTNVWGHSSSPLLFGNKMLVHVDKLTALDKETGKTLWETPSKTGWGSPIHANIEGVDLVITQSGDVVRIDDGKKMVKRALVTLQYNSAIIDKSKNIVYFIQCPSQAFKLTKTESGINAEKLWSTKIHKDRYYASPALTQGLIYAITQKGEFSVLDVEKGDLVYKKKLDLGKKFTFYPSITVAGKNVYISCDDGTTIVLKAGREYKEIGRNTLEKFRCCPLFLADKMYIRAYKNMYCIGK